MAAQKYSHLFYRLDVAALRSNRYALIERGDRLGQFPGGAQGTAIYFPCCRITGVKFNGPGQVWFSPCVILLLKQDIAQGETQQGVIYTTGQHCFKFCRIHGDIWGQCKNTVNLVGDAGLL